MPEFALFIDAPGTINLVGYPERYKESYGSVLAPGVTRGAIINLPLSGGGDVDDLFSRFTAGALLPNYWLMPVVIKQITQFVDKISVDFYAWLIFYWASDVPGLHLDDFEFSAENNTALMLEGPERITGCWSIPLGKKFKPPDSIAIKMKWVFSEKEMGPMYDYMVSRQRRRDDK